MSFLDDIIDVGKGVGGFLGGNSIGSTLVKMVGLGLIASQMNKNLASNNTDTGGADPNIDLGVRLQIPPASDAKVPVLYGSAFFGGIITDAQMTNNNQTMTYCLTLSERTGTVKSTNLSSQYTFNNIYWNNNRIVFKEDGRTISYTVDSGGNIDRSLAGLVTIDLYAGNSSTGKKPAGYTGSINPAYAEMIGWTTSHTMDELIFSIVKVDYSRDKGLSGIGTLKFHISNTLYKPGDVLYDYMTNTRYGAGIPATEIYV